MSNEIVLKESTVAVLILMIDMLDAVDVMEI